MLKSEKVLQAFQGSEEPVAGQLVRCEVISNTSARVLFPLGVIYQGELVSIPLCKPNTVLPISETEDFSLTSEELVLSTGTFINALIVLSEDSQLSLSLNNARLINFRQQSPIGRSTFTLGKAAQTLHPLIFPAFSSQIKAFIANESLSDLKELQTNRKEVFDLEKINKAQDLKWSQEKLQEAQEVVNRHPKTALKLLEDALVLDCSNVNALVLRIRINSGKNEVEKVEKDLSKLLSIDPCNEFALQLQKSMKDKNAKFEIKDKRLINSGFEHKLLYSPN